MLNKVKFACFRFIFSKLKEMKIDNKNILIEANGLITKGDNEGFLDFCTDDIVWDFVGDRVLRGKNAIRAYMKEVYVEPPVFNV